MKKRGFTLIELLVVIAIIGILALLIIINLAGASERARYAKAKAELKTIDDAVTIAFVEASAKPANSAGWDRLGAGAYLLDNLKDSTGANLIQNTPTPPASDWGNYQVYVQGTSDHASGIATPTSAIVGDLCMFRGGSKFIGAVGGKTGTDAACEPAP